MKNWKLKKFASIKNREKTIYVLNTLFSANNWVNISILSLYEEKILLCDQNMKLLSFVPKASVIRLKICSSRNWI
jgi:hypothetical protein